MISQDGGRRGGGFIYTSSQQTTYALLSAEHASSLGSDGRYAAQLPGQCTNARGRHLSHFVIRREWYLAAVINLGKGLLPYKYIHLAVVQRLSSTSPSGCRLRILWRTMKVPNWIIPFADGKLSQILFKLQ